MSLQRSAGLARAEAAFSRGRELGASRADADLLRAMDEIEPRLRPFAWEGAGCALALADRQEAIALLAALGEPLVGFVDVGIGFAAALSGRPPPDRPYCHDGWGFGLTTLRPRSLEDGRVPAEAGPWFDHGVGRALWFSTGAAVRVRPLIRSLPAHRRPMAWRGVGLAAVFAGGWSPEIEAAAGEHAGELQRGMAHGGELRALFGGGYRGPRASINP